MPEHPDSSDLRTGRRLRAIAILALICGVLLTTAARCDATGEDGDGQVPQLVSKKLDEAKKTLEDLGFADPEAEDALKDRTIIKTSNWVVVDQSEAAGRSITRKTQLTLKVAKPDDDGFAALLPGGKTSAPTQTPRTSTKDAPDPAVVEARKAVEAAKKREPCNLLEGLPLDSRFFETDLQEPKRDVSKPDEAGFTQVTVACANSDLGLTVEATTYPTPQAAAEAATVNVADREGFLQRGAIPRTLYPEGGGAIVNPLIGAGRQSFSVGTWGLLVEASFPDSANVQVKRLPDPTGDVATLFADVRAKAQKVITSNDW